MVGAVGHLRDRGVRGHPLQRDGVTRTAAVTVRAATRASDTVVVVSQVSTVERTQLRETAGRLDDSLMGVVGEGLRLALELAP